MQIMDRFVGAACSLPAMPLAALFATYQSLGIAKFEGYSEWSAGKMDIYTDPGDVLSIARPLGIATTSFHLPTIRDDTRRGIETAITAAQYAVSLGAKIVLYKAATKAIYKSIGNALLDAIDNEQLPLTVVIQNHAGGAIETLEDYDEIFKVANDPRLKCILEVGHFQRKGISWNTAWDALEEKFALIHVNDIRNGQSVHYGCGEVDFPGLMNRVKNSSYDGDIVIELELPDNGINTARTIAGLSTAISYLEDCYNA